MSETKFTPGPWMAIPMTTRLHVLDGGEPRHKDGLWGILPENYPERLPIATVDHADDSHAPTREKAQHDARLIAVAPEMYAMLDTVLSIACGLVAIHHGIDPTSPEIKDLISREYPTLLEADGLLAKARGEK